MEIMDLDVLEVWKFFLKKNILQEMQSK